MPQMPVPLPFARTAQTANAMAVTHALPGNRAIEVASDRGQGNPACAWIAEASVPVQPAHSVASVNIVPLEESREHARAEEKLAFRVSARELPAESSEKAVSGEDGNAVAWRRVARDLPVHLSHEVESGVATDRFLGVLSNAGLTRAAIPVVSAVGLEDPGPIGLRRFEGLKEGMSALA
jgi:hypothetical protein